MIFAVFWSRVEELQLTTILGMPGEDCIPRTTLWKVLTWKIFAPSSGGMDRCRPGSYGDLRPGKQRLLDYMAVCIDNSVIISGWCGMMWMCHIWMSDKKGVHSEKQWPPAQHGNKPVSHRQLRKKMRWEPLSIRMCLGSWDDLENVANCSCFICYIDATLVKDLCTQSYFWCMYIVLGGRRCRNLSNSTIQTPLRYEFFTAALRWKAPGALRPSFRRSRSWSSLRLADDCFQCAFRFKGTATCAVLY